MNQIADIIKYEGDNNTFIWKHPCEDFNALTQLIVHESQEAIFFMNGEALDLFGPGRHTLETQNIPKIGKIFNRTVKDNETPFHCEVYFINKSEQMAIKWGTDSKVQFLEPVHQFPISIGASGEMALKVDDSRKLLLKIVGTEKYLGQAQIVNVFRAFLMTKVKTYLASIIREKKINIFEIDEHLNDISVALHGMLIDDFADYGVVLERFFVTTILKPDGEPTYEKFKSLYFRQYADIADAKLRQQVSIIDKQTEAQKIVIESQALAQKRAQEGYTYQQERGFDVASEIAKNEAVGQFTNMGVGLGTMAGVGGAVGGMVGGMVNSAMDAATAPAEITATVTCSNCGSAIPAGKKFCPDCGTPAPQQTASLCPECGAELIPGKKFCAECGHKLVLNCPKCGSELIPGKKFCPDCGNSL